MILTKRATRFPVMEQFYSIQGEGYYQGKAAFFIRLGGCDVGCLWCDVKESWDADAHPQKTVDEILEALQHENKNTDADGKEKKIVVITGGEPLMYDLSELTHTVRQNHFRTHLETSGAYALSGEWDWICFSPKKFKKPLDSVAQKADELKVIVYNMSDLEWAEEHKKTVNKNCRLFLQPEWSRREIMMPLIGDYIKEHPEWEISLQIHKYMNVR